MTFTFQDYIKIYYNTNKKIQQIKIEKVINKILKIKKNKKNKIFILGNGGSSAISNHVATDLIKNAKVKTVSFSDSSLITCLSNDYGHDKWMKKALEFNLNKGDLVILISSSGNSKNIINAAKFCFQKKIDLITFSGMTSKNKLIKENKRGVNIWVDSKSYNIIEISHLTILLYIVDRVIGKLIYKSL